MMQLDVRYNLQVTPLTFCRPAGAAPMPANGLVRIVCDRLPAADRDRLCRDLAARAVTGGTDVPDRADRFTAVASVAALQAHIGVWAAASAALRQVAAELQAALQPLSGTLRLGNGNDLLYGERALVMGIINVTPDSFYAASRQPDAAGARAVAQSMVAQGADLLDVGGESTRPGAAPVTAEEECARVVPVIEAIAGAGGPPVSVDTSKAEVARAALDAGAALVNDVAGLADPALVELVAERGVPVVIMHMRGTPRTMQQRPRYADTVGEVLGELKLRINRAVAAGIAPEQIIVDPGIGFGKRVEDNLRLLTGVATLRSIAPVLIGVSRKSFLGVAGVAEDAPPPPVEQRLPATTAANTVALLAGADIVRVHDVAAAAQAVRVVAALRSASAANG